MDNVPKAKTKIRLGPKINCMRGTRNIALAVAVDTAVTPTIEAKPQPINAASIITTLATPVSSGMNTTRTRIIDTT